MKAQLLKVFPGHSNSFTAREDVGFDANKRWHYHPEIEFIYIKTGEGTHFIGDSVQKFKAGDIFMIGSQLPHFFKFDDVFLKSKGDAAAHVSVTQFAENFWGDKFLQLPENTNVRLLLEKARRGYTVPVDITDKIAATLDELQHSVGLERIILLLHVLNKLAHAKNMKQLSSVAFNHGASDLEDERINAIYEYSFANYKRKIDLNEIAEVARISPNSFCRYFKLKTKKTYSQFITEIRVGHACKLLIENKYFIKHICYESGFNNFASFNKYFKLTTGKSPLNYQKEFMSA
ncbi:AraC-like DNA-binding protein [Mucilaginibacter gracilis]|uniref:AraC-like DNA-binding protein n=1 Tax=Mucilaginibacter gracilis TaxID=423350 RepID=A0A495IWB2_9SPHI|nr:helix-turn-helix transcriptional regulator [Mucilaginibacter gracilis]RKR80882.1 AraC-like DNA-binding protein [Mucilaginibacter gracilis]